MKNLLLMALVLGIGSLAGAAVSYDLSINDDTEATEISILAPSGTATIGVYATYGTEDGPDDFWIGIASVNGDAEWLWDTVQTGPGAGSTLDLSDGGYVEYVWGYYDGASQPGSWSNGMVMSIDLHCLSQGDVEINLYDASGYNVIETVTVHQTPEPMSLALLGLGGLFLRRRK